MTAPTLRVLTLNCWNISAPFDERMALVREGIERLQPDLIGLHRLRLGRVRADPKSCEKAGRSNHRCPPR